LKILKIQYLPHVYFRSRRRPFQAEKTYAIRRDLSAFFSDFDRLRERLKSPNSRRLSLNTKRMLRKLISVNKSNEKET